MTARIQYPKIRHKVIAILFALLCTKCLAQDADHLTEVRRILATIESQTVSDKDVVQMIGKRLDVLSGATDPGSVREKAKLIRLSVFVPHSPDAAVLKMAEDERRRALGAYSNASFNLDMDGRELLYLGAGMMGLQVSQKEVINFAKIKSNPVELRLLALESVLAQSNIQYELTADLDALSNDDFHYDQVSDVGSPERKTTYPIRDVAEILLKKMHAASLGQPGDDGRRKPKEPSASTSQAADGRSPPPTPSSKPSSFRPWSIAAVLIVTALGLLWLLLKRRN